jgi:integrase/recombinase XerD
MKQRLPWMELVKKYLAYRRSFGFELKTEAILLRQFGRFAGAQQDQEHLTVELAAAWARASNRQSPITWARRIEVLRGFAKYLQRFDSATIVPQRDLFGPSHRRLVPHIYTDEELSELLEATKLLSPIEGLRPATCKAVFGLLAATGLRISEAVNLHRMDVDLTSDLLHIREAKFHKDRWVPVHPSVTEALRSYETLRDRIVLSPRTAHFFLLDNGEPATRRGINYALGALCKHLGWQPRGDYSRHRLHDFRHTFIVRSVLHSYQAGIAPDQAVASISMYVGHAKVTDTYWYFTATPELMSIAARRFQKYFQEGTL